MGSVDFYLMYDCLCSLIEFTDKQLILTRPEASSDSGEPSKPTGKTRGGQGLPLKKTSKRSASRPLVPRNHQGEASSSSGEPPKPTGKTLGGQGPPPKKTSNSSFKRVSEAWLSSRTLSLLLCFVPPKAFIPVIASASAVFMVACGAFLASGLLLPQWTDLQALPLLDPRGLMDIVGIMLHPS